MTQDIYILNGPELLDLIEEAANGTQTALVTMAKVSSAAHRIPFYRVDSLLKMLEARKVQLSGMCGPIRRELANVIAFSAQLRQASADAHD